MMPTVLSLICRLAEVEKSDDDAAAAIQKEVDEVCSAHKSPEQCLFRAHSSMLRPWPPQD